MDLRLTTRILAAYSQRANARALFVLTEIVDILRHLKSAFNLATSVPSEASATRK